MYSLTFLSAQQLARDEEATCTMLESMPQITYNILFKVAFRENKIKLLCELVKMWPYSQLKFQALLQICWSCSLTSPKKCPECQETLKNNESSKNKIDAIIFGVISSIKKAIMDDSQQLPNRRLQQLDMTGLVNQNIWWNLTIMRLWASSISRAQLYVSSQHDPQSQTRDQEAKASPVTTFPKEMCMELLVDLQVSSSSKKFLKEAFSANANSPLHLKCQDLYTTDIIDHDFGQLLSLLDPLTIRRVDLNYGKIILNDVGWFLSQITTFQNLQSLKLPSFSEQEIQKMNSTPKTLVDILAAELSKLKHLREISVHSLCLSDKVEDLLRDLPCSLESLQLSFCSLTTKDLIYLAHNQHSTHLIKLDLAGNKLTDQLDAFLELLKSASNSLKWLNVTKCGIKDSDFHKTLSYLYSCIRLSHLGLHANPLSSTILLDFLKSCQHKLPNMKIISVPIFLDCYREHSQHDCFPRLLESHLDTNKLGSVLREMKQMQITRGESAIEVLAVLCLGPRFPAMYSLTFLSARQMTKVEENTCKMLESMPLMTYNILFKMAYRYNNMQLLCELVKMWPYPQLKFQMLLQTCWCRSWTSKKCPQCKWTVKYDESSKNKIDAIILGVINYIRKVITDGSQQLPNRYCSYFIRISHSLFFVMYSLRYLSARQLVQNEEATCKIMEFFPRQLYGILLKVAFRYKKSMLLQELVKNWPFPQLKVQMILQICHQCIRISKKCSDCQWTFPYNETSKNNFDDIIKGVISYIKEIINDGSKTLPSRRLQQLDMTGLLGKYVLWNHKLMRVWASSISRAKICTLQQKIHDSENQVPETSTFPVELRVDFLVDLEVTLKSEEFLMAALQDNINSLLHLTCRDFYVQKLSVRDAAKFLVPLDPLVLRRIDLSKGQMRLMDIGWFMSQISIFQNMKSLKFPEFEFTKWWEEPNLKTQFDIFVTESNKLKHLTEIAFYNICLSDHLEYLLGGLLCSLQSLELSYCCLTNKDLTYLARSQHSTHLIKLNLNGNSIDQTEPVLELLKAASCSLVWLNMAFCGITDSKFYAALPSLCCCSKLSYLGLYGNQMTSTSVLTLLKQYQHKLPHLKAVAIPIFSDCCPNLLDFRHLPRSMESHINASKLNSVLKELEELPRAEQESPINYTLNCNFPVIDYFDFQ